MQHVEGYCGEQGSWRAEITGVEGTWKKKIRHTELLAISNCQGDAVPPILEQRRQTPGLWQAQEQPAGALRGCLLSQPPQTRPEDGSSCFLPFIWGAAA